VPRLPNLTGHWTGYYVQRDEQHLIAAEFHQDGESVTGSMFDRDTTRDESLFEMAARSGWAPGQDEQITRWIREQIPDQPFAPIRAVSRMPAHSTLEGHIQGREVYFLKTMRGEHFVGYRVGNKEIGITIRRHTVHYKGHLSEDGRSLEGRWWIDPRKEYNAGQRTEGDFLLQRE
jgi:hypothetical protein